MALEQHVADTCPAFHPTIQPPPETVDGPPADSRIRDARFVAPSGPRAEMELLADRIAELSARIQAATWQSMAKPPLHSTGDASRLNSVARRSHIANMLAPRALSAGRLTGLGATRGLRHGLLSSCFSFTSSTSGKAGAGSPPARIG